MRGGLLVALAIFVALALWDTWEAVGNLIGLPPYYDALGIAPATPWWLLIGALVLAVAALTLGVFVALRSDTSGQAVAILLVIITSHAALSVSVLSVEQAWRAHHVLELVSSELGLD